MIFHIDLESLYGYNQVLKNENAGPDEQVDTVPYYLYVLDNTQSRVDSDLEFVNEVRVSKTEDASRKVYYDLTHLSDKYTARDFQIVYEIPEGEMHKEFNLEVGIGKFRQDDPDDPETETTLVPLISRNFLFYIYNKDQKSEDVLNRDVYDVNFKLADNDYPEDFAVDFKIEEVVPDYFPSDYIAFNDFNQALYPGETEDKYLTYRYLPQGTYKVTLTPNYDDYEPLEEMLYLAGQEEDHYFNIQKKTHPITIRLTGEERMTSRIVDLQLIDTTTQAAFTMEHDAATDSYTAELPYGEYQIAFLYDDMTTLPKFTVTLDGIEEDPTYLRFNVDENTVLPLNLVYTVQEDEVTEEPVEEPTEGNEGAVIVLNEDDLQQTEEESESPANEAEDPPGNKEESTVKDEEESPAKDEEAAAAEQNTEETVPAEQPVTEEQLASEEQQVSEEDPVEAEEIKLDDIVEDEKPEETEKQQEEIRLPEETEEQTDEAAEEQPANEEQAEKVQESETPQDKQVNSFDVPVFKTEDTQSAVKYDAENQPGNVALNAMRGNSSWDYEEATIDYQYGGNSQEAYNDMISFYTDKNKFMGPSYGNKVTIVQDSEGNDKFIRYQFAIQTIRNNDQFLGIQLVGDPHVLENINSIEGAKQYSGQSNTYYADLLMKNDQRQWIKFVIDVPIIEGKDLYELKLRGVVFNSVFHWLKPNTIGKIKMSSKLINLPVKRIESPEPQKGSITFNVAKNNYDGKNKPTITVTGQGHNYTSGGSDPDFTLTETGQGWQGTLSDVEAGNYTAEISASDDGMIVVGESTADFTVTAGESQTVNFKIDKKSAPETGTLRVNVNGKGSTYTGDGNPTILITGPNGYSKEITGAEAWQSTLNSLKFGTYQVKITPASDMELPSGQSNTKTLTLSSKDASQTVDFSVKDKLFSLKLNYSTENPGELSFDDLKNTRATLTLTKNGYGFSKMIKLSDAVDASQTLQIPFGTYDVSFNPGNANAQLVAPYSIDFNRDNQTVNVVFAKSSGNFVRVNFVTTDVNKTVEGIVIQVKKEGEEEYIPYITPAVIADKFKTGDTVQVNFAGDQTYEAFSEPLSTTLTASAGSNEMITIRLQRKATKNFSYSIDANGYNIDLDAISAQIGEFSNVKPSQEVALTYPADPRSINITGYDPRKYKLEPVGDASWTVQFAGNYDDITHYTYKVSALPNNEMWDVISDGPKSSDYTDGRLKLSYTGNVEYIGATNTLRWVFDVKFLNGSKNSNKRVFANVQTKFGENGTFQDLGNIKDAVLLWEQNGIAQRSGTTNIFKDNDTSGVIRQNSVLRYAIDFDLDDSRFRDKNDAEYDKYCIKIAFATDNNAGGVSERGWNKAQNLTICATRKQFHKVYLHSKGIDENGSPFDPTQLFKVRGSAQNSWIGDFELGGNGVDDGTLVDKLAAAKHTFKLVPKTNKVDLNNYKVSYALAEEGTMPSDDDYVLLTSPNDPVSIDLQKDTANHLFYKLEKLPEEGTINIALDVTDKNGDPIAVPGNTTYQLQKYDPQNGTFVNQGSPVPIKSKKTHVPGVAFGFYKVTLQAPNGFTLDHTSSEAFTLSSTNREANVSFKMQGDPVLESGEAYFRIYDYAQKPNKVPVYGTHLELYDSKDNLLYSADLGESENERLYNDKDKKLVNGQSYKLKVTKDKLTTELQFVYSDKKPYYDVFITIPSAEKGSFDVAIRHNLTPEEFNNLRYHLVDEYGNVVEEAATLDVINSRTYPLGRYTMSIGNVPAGYIATPSPQVVELTADNSPVKVNFNIQPDKVKDPVEVTVNLVLEDGRPAPPGIKVSVFNESGFKIDARDIVDGTAKFTGMPAGERLTFEFEGIKYPYQRPSNTFINVPEDAKTAEATYVLVADPTAAPGQFKVKFVDIATNEPVSGVTVILESKDPAGQQYKLVSDSHGYATLEELPAGSYKYKVVPPQGPGKTLHLFEPSDSSEGRDVFEFELNEKQQSYFKKHPLTSDDIGKAVISYVDKSDNPVPYETLEISRINKNHTKTLVLTKNTGADGKLTVDPIPYGNYEVCTPSSDVQNRVCEKFTINSAATKEVTLVRDLNEGYGTLKARLLIDNKDPDVQEPASHVLVLIRNHSQRVVDRQYSDDDGYVTSKALKINDGAAQKYILEPMVLYTAYAQSKPKSAMAHPRSNWTKEDLANPDLAPVFKLVKPTYDPDADAMRIGITGNKVDSKIDWSVTFTRFAPPEGVKRGSIHKISVPKNQMSNPTVPTLTVKYMGLDENNKPVEITETRELSGRFVSVGDEYVFIDDQTQDMDDIGDREVKYIYSFETTASPSSNEYTVTAEAELKSSSINERFPRAKGSLTLQNINGANVTVDINGEASTDWYQQETNWTWTSNINSDFDGLVDGKLYYDFDIPDDALTDFSKIDEQSPVFTIKDKNGNEVPSDKFTYEVMDNPNNENGTNRRLRVIIPLKRAGRFDDQYTFEFKALKSNPAVNADMYRMNATISYYNKDDEEPLKTATATAETTVAAPYAPDYIETTSNCNQGKGEHRLYISGDPTPDGKMIFWRVRMTNINARRVFQDYQGGMKITLSDNLEMPMVESSDPALTGQQTPLQQLYNGLIFDTNNNSFPYATMNGNGEDNSFVVQINDHNDSPFKRIAEHPSYAWYDNAWKKRNSIGKIVNYNRDDQRFERGEYIEVAFYTPVKFKDSEGNLTDISKFSLNVETKVYGDKSASYNTGSTVCSQDQTLTLEGGTKWPTSGSFCNFTENGKGGVTTSAAIEEDTVGGERRKYIRWNIKVVGARNKEAWITEEWQQEIDVNFQILNGSSYDASQSTGLGPIQDFNVDANVAKEIKRNYSQYSGNYRAAYNMINQAVISFRTEIIDETKLNYQMKVEAKSRRFLNVLDPFFHKIDGSPCVTVVNGFKKKIQFDKAWENLYTLDEKPETTFYLERIDPADPQQIRHLVSTKTLPKNAQKSDYYSAFDGLYDVYNESGDKYTYFVTEEPLEGFSSSVYRVSTDDTEWRVTNVKTADTEDMKDPTEYATDQGVYPKDYRQDGPDVRNAHTEMDENHHEDPWHGNDPGTRSRDNPNKYKITYPDSIIGKSAQQTEIPGTFDMKLTVEGATKYGTSGVDVVLVLDNSNSMNDVMDNLSESSLQKWKALQNAVNILVDDILGPDGGTSTGNRMGLVNFATLAIPTTTQRTNGKVYNDNGIYNVDLTRNKNDLKKGYQKFPRANRGVTGNEAHGKVDIGISLDGLTNIADGIRAGAEMLQKDGPTRKKIMIVITDGAPTAHLKLKNYPLDPKSDLEEQLRFNQDLANSRAPYAVEKNYKWGKYTMSNNTIFFMPRNRNSLNYKAGDRWITNNILPTYAVADYFKERYPDMEIYSVAVEGRVPASEGAESVKYMKEVAKNITTDPENNYYLASNTQQLNDFSKYFQGKVLSDSIRNGRITDPMGEQIELKVDYPAPTLNQGVHLASSPELKDGDVFVFDNHGYYLDPSTGQSGWYNGKLPIEPNYEEVELKSRYFNVDGVHGDYWITNNEKLKVRLKPDDKSIYQYFDTESNQWKDNRISETNSQMRYLFAEPVESYTGIYHAPIPNDYGKLSGDNAVIVDNIMIQHGNPALLTGNRIQNGNQTWTEYYPQPSLTTLLKGVKVSYAENNSEIRVEGLNLGAHQEVTVLYKTRLKTEDPNYNEDTYYQANKTTYLEPDTTVPESYIKQRNFPIPSVKGPMGGMTLKKEWLKGDGIPLGDMEIPVDSVTVEIYQWKTKGFHDGKSESSNEPHEVTLVERRDSAAGFNTGFPLTVTLNRRNDWKFVASNFPVWDTDGDLFVYQIKENSPEDFNPVETFYIPYITYSKQEGTRSKTAQEIEEGTNLRPIYIYDREGHRLDNYRMIGKDGSEMPAPGDENMAQYSIKLKNERLTGLRFWKVDQNTKYRYHFKGTHPDGYPLEDKPEYFADYYLEGAEFNIYRASDVTSNTGEYGRQDEDFLNSVKISDEYGQSVFDPEFLNRHFNVATELAIDDYSGQYQGTGANEPKLIHQAERPELLLETLKLTGRELLFLMGQYEGATIDDFPQLKYAYPIFDHWNGHLSFDFTDDQLLENGARSQNYENEKDGLHLGSRLRIHSLIASDDEFKPKLEFVTTAVAKSDGSVEVPGVGPGLYWVEETKSPEGTVPLEEGNLKGFFYVPKDTDAEFYPDDDTTYVLNNMMKAGMALPKRVQEGNTVKPMPSDVTGGKFLLTVDKETWNLILNSPEGKYKEPTNLGPVATQEEFDAYNAAYREWVEKLNTDPKAQLANSSVLDLNGVTYSIGTEEYILKKGDSQKTVYPLLMNGQPITAEVGSLPKPVANAEFAEQFPQYGWVIFGADQMPLVTFNNRIRDDVEFFVVEEEAPGDFPDPVTKSQNTTEVEEQGWVRVEFNADDYFSKDVPYQLLYQDGYQIKNRKTTTNFRIQKTNDQAEPIKLKDSSAEFRLWEFRLADNVYGYTFGPSEAVPEMSDDGYITFDNLDENSVYFVEEVTAPAGYLMDGDAKRKVQPVNNQGEAQDPQIVALYKLQTPDYSKYTTQQIEDIVAAEDSGLSEDKKILKHLTEAIKTVAPDTDHEVWHNGDYAWFKEAVNKTKTTGDKVTLITVTPAIQNRPTKDIELKVHKVSDDAEPQNLKGATFRLIDLTDFDATSTIEDHSTKTVSNEEGLVSFKNLSEGTYLLEELQAPSGYVRNSEAIYLRVFYFEDGKEVPAEKASSDAYLKVEYKKVYVNTGQYLADPDNTGKTLSDYYASIQTWIDQTEGNKTYKENYFKVLGDGDSLTDVTQEPTEEEAVMQIDYVNRLIQLPATGGLGFTVWSLLVGLLFLSFAALVLRRNRLVWEGGGYR